MTNLEIAQAAKLRPISEVADAFHLSEQDYEPLGRFKGKLTTEGVQRLTHQQNGKLVLVTAITPTPSGEGKTTVTIGLTQGLNKIGKQAVSATREPALGPIFGVKGGACGGGYSQVLPMEDINLFFNGDFPAISAAHNLLSALLDAHVHHGNVMNIDTRVDTWPRTVDMNDRALRSIITGLGGRANGPVREGSVVITPASEVMAVLCLSRDINDLKQRLGNLLIGNTVNRQPVRARDIIAHGAMTALLRDAIRPNIVQTVEGGLALVHGGPFGNIAHGCSSLVSTECGLGLAEYTVTEAGFASDLGAEKFLNIVCPRLGRGPDAIVLVATIRALKHHGGGDLELGYQNLARHARHLKHYGPPLVVAINRFADDSETDFETMNKLCKADDLKVVLSNPWGEGGNGCTSLAEEVVTACNTKSQFRPLYSDTDAFETKLDNIVRKAYGGDGFELSDEVKKTLEWAKLHGYGSLPVCVAKTQYSLSDDATKLNAPTRFKVRIRDLKISAGAGFLVAISGDIMRMPGLGKNPAAFNIDVNKDGRITGLF